MAREKHINPKYSAYVTHYSADEYRRMKARTYLSVTGKSGYALLPDGSIISVFSHPNSGEGPSILRDAIRHGGRKLDCFDGFLSREFYPRFGFKEVGRLKWDDKYKPEGWNTKRDDHPDVVLMELRR